MAPSEQRRTEALPAPPGSASASASVAPGPLDVWVDVEGARLRLARPIESEFGRVDALTLDLGRLPQPLDLRWGAFGLRGRPRRVDEVSLWLSPEALGRWARERGVTLELDRCAPELHLTLRDELGALGVGLRAWSDGSDLLLRPLHLRARSGSQSPLERYRRGARRLGELEGDTLRLRAPLFWLLAHALAPFGQRAPRAAVAPPVRVTAEGGGIRIASGDVPAPTSEDEALQRAPLVVWPGEVAAGEGDEPAHVRAERDFSAALADADPRRATAAFETLLDEDPSPTLIAEAACLLARITQPGHATQLFSRAAAVAGADLGLLARVADAAATRGPDAAVRNAEVIAAAPLADVLRGEIMAHALRGAVPAPSSAEQGPTLGLAEDQPDEVSAAVEEALRLAPSSPQVHLLAGDACHQRGELAHALDHYRRAARAFLAADRAVASGEASLRVADALDALGRESAAERVLVDARAETDDAPVVVARLARRWADAGLVPDALRAYAALLRQPTGRPGLAPALLEASRFALDQGNVVAATPLIARLRTMDAAEGGALAGRLRSLASNVSHVNGPWDPDDSEGA